MDEHPQPEDEPEWLDHDDFERLLAEVLPDPKPQLPPLADKRVYERAGRGDTGS
ncbi:hypothetical protein [Embleya sp. NPDC001921]